MREKDKKAKEDGDVPFVARPASVLSLQGVPGKHTEQIYTEIYKHKSVAPKILRTAA